VVEGPFGIDPVLWAVLRLAIAIVLVIALIMMGLNYRWLLDHPNLHVPSLGVLILIGIYLASRPNNP